MLQVRPLPGVVVVAAWRQTWREACTGSVVKITAIGHEFEAYVLTAKHCLVKDDHGPLPLGVTVPHHDDDDDALESTVFAATVAYVSSVDGTAGAGTVVWDEGDWAVLRVRTPTRWSIVEPFNDDPKRAIPAGARTELLTYADRAFIDLHARRIGLVAHAHPFHWTGVPEDIQQGGHSGAPVVWDGKLVAMFVGATDNSLGCQLFCGERWPTKLRFVSIASIRAQAAHAGFQF